MNRTNMLIAAGAAVVALMSGTELAKAREVPFQTREQLKSTCAAGGGAFNAGGPNGVYSCDLGDAGIVSCGGVGEHAKTCSNTGLRTFGAGTIRIQPGLSWQPAGSYQAQPGYVPRPTRLFQAH